MFEGASAEVDAFLSVASKAAALALLLRVGIGLTHIEAGPEEAVALTKTSATLASTDTGQTHTALKPTLLVAEEAEADAPAADVEPMTPVRNFVVTILAIVAMVTCTFGNLAAYGQTNIKRMLGYSTIAHAGFMIMAVAAAIALVGTNIVEAHAAVSALLLYVTIYLFMNLGAFAIIAFLRNSMQSEEIEDYAGLVRSEPLVAVMMTAILVSLIGLPPLAGFWPKLRVLQALFEAGGTLMITTMVVAGLNTAISLVYYLRVCKTMCIDEPSDTQRPVSLGFLPLAYVLVVSVPVLIFGLLPDEVARWADQAARQFFT